MSAAALRTQPVHFFWEDVTIAIPSAFRLESGDVLEDGRIEVRRHGPRNAPKIVALGGISAGKRVAGDDGWWADVVATGGGVDLDAFEVIGIDFAPLDDRRVRITPKDQARLIVRALDALATHRLHAFVGASYGGMVGLAFAALAPERLNRLVVISASDRPSALGLAWRGVQRRIVEFGLQNGDGAGGLALARQLAMTTYRTRDEFEARFGAGVDESGRGEVDAYLIARGNDYPRVMAPNRWLSLSEAIDRHEVDISNVVTPTTLIACPDDQLAPYAELEALSRRLPRLAAFHALPSIYGHDAFLKEAGALGVFLRNALETVHV